MEDDAKPWARCFVALLLHEAAQLQQLQWLGTGGETVPKGIEASASKWKRSVTSRSFPLSSDDKAVVVVKMRAQSQSDLEYGARLGKSQPEVVPSEEQGRECPVTPSLA